MNSEPQGTTVYCTSSGTRVMIPLLRVIGESLSSYATLKRIIIIIIIALLNALVLVPNAVINNIL